MYCPDRTLTRGEMSASLYRLVNNLDGITGPAGPEEPAGPQGPQGDPGPAGPAGVTDVTVRRRLAVTPEFTVHCEPGEMAIGGGGVNDMPDSTQVLIGSYPYPEAPDSTPTGWTAVFTGTAGGTSGQGTKAYAICATINE